MLKIECSDEEMVVLSTEGTKDSHDE